MRRAFTIIRVSAEDQLKGYGPDSQWEDDVLPNAPLLGLECYQEHRRIVQERATTWERSLWEAAIHEALGAYHKGEVQALLFPRVDRETRFIYSSFPLLIEVIKEGMQVFFAREGFELNPDDPESTERYLSKASQAQAYVQTMRQNTMRGRKRRALSEHKLPNGQVKWPFDYDKATGKAVINKGRAAWVRKWAEWLLTDGASLRGCCRQMEEAGILSPKGSKRWSPSTITRMLLDRSMIGEFWAWKEGMERPNSKKRPKGEPKLIYEDKAETILTLDQYEALKARLKSNQLNAPRNTKLDYPPLRGFGFCYCNHRLGGVPIHGYPYYRCPVHRKPLLNARWLWNQVKGNITEMLLNPDRLIPQVRDYLDAGKHIENLERELGQKQFEHRYWEAAEDKAVRMHLILPDYSEEKLLKVTDDIANHKAKVREGIKELEKQLNIARQAQVDEEALRYFCNQVKNNLGDLTHEQWRVLLEKLRFRYHIDSPENPTIVIKVAIPKLSNTEVVLQHS